MTTTSDAAAEATPARSFDEVFRAIADVQGWMTRGQACKLWDRAGELSAGDTVVEIGSFHGRSAIVLATSAPEGVRIFTIDPHGGNDRGPQELDGFAEEAEQDHQTFLANLARAGVRSRIHHLRKFSDDALEDVPGLVELLYIDGAHRYAPAVADIRKWGRKVSLGGTMLIHDSFSSVGVTLALMATTFFGGRFRYVGRANSMAEYERVDLTPADRAANAFRQLLEMPYFLRNLLIKVLITAKLAPLTKVLGGDGQWPY